MVQRPVLYLGEINDSQHAAWCRVIEAFDEGSGRYRQLALFPAERAVLTPFLRALAEAAEWFGGHVEESAAIAAKRTSIEPRYALRACQVLAGGGIIPRDLRSAPAALAAVTGALRSSGLIPPTLPPGAGPSGADPDPIAAAVDYSYL